MIPTRAFVAGLAGALAVWTAAFRGRSRFWEKMTLGVGLLGVWALRSNPDLRPQRPRPRDVITGLGSAALLYGIFQFGDWAARRVMPEGAADIDNVYALRGRADVRFIAPALALIVGPGEELFWRGLVNAYLMQRLGRVAGSLVGSVVYGAVHLVTGNATLTGAATAAGGYWSVQYLLEGRIPPLILSHAVWDVWIFLIQPTTRVGAPSSP